MEDEEKLSGSLAAIFKEFTDIAQADQDIRDQIKLKVRELEQGNREAVAILAKIHHCDGLSRMEELLANVDSLLDSNVKERITALSTVIPKGQYFRFHQHFNYSLQRLVFVATLIHYLRHDKLIFWAPTAQRLGMTHDQELRDERHVAHVQLRQVDSDCKQQLSIFQKCKQTSQLDMADRAFQGTQKCFRLLQML